MQNEGLARTEMKSENLFAIRCLLDAALSVYTIGSSSFPTDDTCHRARRLADQLTQLARDIAKTEWQGGPEQHRLEQLDKELQ